MFPIFQTSHPRSQHQGPTRASSRQAPFRQTIKTPQLTWNPTSNSVVRQRQIMRVASQKFTQTQTYRIGWRQGRVHRRKPTQKTLAKWSFRRNHLPCHPSWTLITARSTWVGKNRRRRSQWRVKLKASEAHQDGWDVRQRRVQPAKQ